MSTPPYSSEFKDPVVREVQETPNATLVAGDTHSVSAWFGAGFGQHGSKIEKMGGCPESKTTLNGSAWSSNAIDQSRCGRMRCEKKGAIRRRMMSMGRLVGKPGPSGAKCVPGSAMSPRDRLCVSVK